MRFLVTGTSGFIGTSFCERFSSRSVHDLVGIDRLTPREVFDGVDYRRVELRSSKDVTRLVLEVRPTVIVHLAAQARVDPSLQSAEPTYRDNVESTINLLAAAESLGNRLERFVYASSETVYGTASTYPCHEDTPLCPNSPYAASKAACELLVSRALRERALILRSGMGYGPRSDPKAQVIGKFVTRAIRGEALRFPKETPRDLHPTRDVNFVGNFLDGLEQAIASNVSGTFNVASGREISVLDLAKRIVGSVGRGSVEFTDAFEYRPGEVGARTWLDISKARQSFGYEPRVPLEEGLKLTIDWYRSNPLYFAEKRAEAVLTADP